MYFAYRQLLRVWYEFHNHCLFVIYVKVKVKLNVKDNVDATDTFTSSKCLVCEGGESGKCYRPGLGAL